MSPVRDLTPGATRDDAAGPGERAEEIRERHPESPAWRADALAASQHRRLSDDIPEPRDDFDPDRAADLCATITRDLLRDYAAGLALLPLATRRRLQALAAHAVTLFDFARQRGLEGERLAQINRWEFTLDTVLSGHPVGQPVFVAMAASHTQRPWDRDALDSIAAAARRRVTADDRRPWDESDDRRLAEGLAAGLGLGGPAAEHAAHVAVHAFALRRALEAGAALPPEPPRESLSRGISDASALGGLAAFLHYAERTTRALSRQRSRGSDRAPRLTLLTRIRLLLAARFGSRR